MAGSYHHCRGENGKFRFDLIENLGDAHEACEMMFHMINTLSGGDRRQIHLAEEAYYSSINPSFKPRGERRSGKDRREP